MIQKNQWKIFSYTFSLKSRIFFPPKIHFSFLIAVPPSVQPLPQDGKFVVRKGSTITLECESKGNPPPKITWQRSVSILIISFG